MSRYFAIESPIKMEAGYAEMRTLHWRNGAIEADFAIPGDSQNNLRVSFKSTEIIRVLDEMPLSTEDEFPESGHVPNNFAYRVEGALFWRSQSEALKLTVPTMEHYRFITGSTCLDVLSELPPLMMVVPANAGPSWYAN